MICFGFRDIEDSDEFDTDLEDEAKSSQDEAAAEPRKAPNELFLEVPQHSKARSCCSLGSCGAFFLMF